MRGMTSSAFPYSDAAVLDAFQTEMNDTSGRWRRSGRSTATYIRQSAAT